MYKILSLDGGGVRGLIPTQILAHLESRLIDELGDPDLRVIDFFDFICGTSAGGALSLTYLLPPVPGSRRYSAKDVWQQYQKLLPSVFSLNLWDKINTGWGLTKPKYDAHPLETWFRFLYHNYRLSQIEKPCLITAYDYLSRRPLYFRSHRAALTASEDFELFDVARATSAAPSYFAPHTLSNIDESSQYYCLDGIVFAYSPALAAYAEVRTLSNTYRASSMYLLSLGTGIAHEPVESEEMGEWGGLHWGAVIAKMMADGSALTVDDQLRNIFLDSPENYLRLNPHLAEEVSSEMDCATPENIAMLGETTQKYIDSHQSEIDSIISVLIEDYRPAHHKTAGVKEYHPDKFLHFPYIDPEQVKLPVSFSADSASQAHFFCADHSMDFNQFNQLTDRLTHYLLKTLNLQPSDRILAVLDVNLSSLLFVWSICRLGASVSLLSKMPDESTWEKSSESYTKRLVAGSFFAENPWLAQHQPDWLSDGYDPNLDSRPSQPKRSWLTKVKNLLSATQKSTHDLINLPRIETGLTGESHSGRQDLNLDYAPPLFLQNSQLGFAYNLTDLAILTEQMQSYISRKSYGNSPLTFVLADVWPHPICLSLAFMVAPQHDARVYWLSDTASEQDILATLDKSCVYTLASANWYLQTADLLEQKTVRFENIAGSLCLGPATAMRAWYRCTKQRLWVI